MSTYQLIPLLLHLADNALIMGQRNAEWCGHGPVLEQDIAITNISLDQIGQARNFYQYAAVLYNEQTAEEQKSLEPVVPQTWKTFDRALQEDDLAFLREERQYRNLLLCELPKGDWAHTILKQFFFSTFQYQQYQQLQQGSDAQLAAIAEKSVKEVAYHLRWSGEWVIRLGDGTEESRMRMHRALETLWSYTGEMFVPAPYETKLLSTGVLSLESIKSAWMEKVLAVFSEAGLTVPEQGWSQSGGKEGNHTEHLGYLLAELQYLQRTYPNATW